jgi:hypothetical protein
VKSKTVDIVANLADNSGTIRLDSERAVNHAFVSYGIQFLVDSEGNEAAFEKLKWSDPISFVKEGISGVKYSSVQGASVLSLSKSLIGRINFTIDAEFFDQSGTLQYGSSKFSVFPGSLKLSYQISSWPFTFSNSSLYMGMISSSSGSGIFRSGSKVSIGNGLIDCPLLAFADQKEQAIQVSLKESSSKEALFLFRFPQYSRSLYYDPVISLQPSSTSSSSSEDSLLYPILGGGIGILAVGGALLGYFVHVRRQRRKAIALQSALTKASNSPLLL